MKPVFRSAATPRSNPAIERTPKGFGVADFVSRLMLSNALKLALVLCGLAMLPCHGSSDSILVGEWESISVDADVIGRVTYRADHTWSGCVDDPRHGSFRGSGVWRIEGNQMITADGEHPESRAEILAISQAELRIKAPDGIISSYVRVK